jgi:alpha-ketoglutarate-dependent taurine dioxygenase
LAEAVCVVLDALLGEQLSRLVDQRHVVVVFRPVDPAGDRQLQVPTLRARPGV